MERTDFTGPETIAPRMDWRWMVAIGAVLVVGGVLAFLNPFLASLTVEVIAGAAFLAGGLMQLWMALSGGNEPSDRWLSALLGAALAVLGIALLADPLAGLVSLTLAVGVMFAVTGGLRLALAFRLRPAAGWGWMLGSGVLSILLALMILFTLPASSLGLLGLLLGVDLVTAGAVSIALGLRARRG